MNLETAARLAQLRKQFGYSQEALAEQLGISRQAISKWERAESAPDTDNLIALSKLYGLTLDDLLDTSADKVSVDIPKQAQKEAQRRRGSLFPEKQLYPKAAKFMLRFPFPLAVIALFCLLGMTAGVWHPAWLLFLLVPIYYLVALACKMGSLRAFLLALPVPVICAAVYMMTGFFFGLWAKTWFLFVLIPAYYWAVASFAPGKKNNTNDDTEVI